MERSLVLVVGGLLVVGVLILVVDRGDELRLGSAEGVQDSVDPLDESNRVAEPALGVESTGARTSIGQDNGDGEALDRGFDLDWLPVVPRVEVVGTTGSELLEAYWREDWPFVEAYLDESSGGTIPPMLESWVGVEGSPDLGDRDAFIGSLPERILARFRSHSSPISRVMKRRLTVPLFRASERALGFEVIREVNERLGVGLRGLEISGAVDDLYSSQSQVIDDSIDEIVALGQTADDAIAAFIAQDVRPLGDGHAPRYGALFLGPITSVRHWDHAEVEPENLVVLTCNKDRRSEDGLWNANYSLDVRLVPGVDVYSQQMREAADRLREYLTSIAEIQLGG